MRVRFRRAGRPTSDAAAAGAGSIPRCCDTMAYQLVHRCDVHEDPQDCPDVVVKATGGGFRLPIHDGGSSGIAIEHCPWCGTRLS